MKLLSPIELDALTEIINIGVGRAARSLGDIVGDHIVLKVPKVELIPLEKLPYVLRELEQKRISSVSQSFQGDLVGSAALVFPPESAVRLVSVLTGEEDSSSELDSVRSGTLMEIGNIVINGVLGTMVNILKCNLEFSLPEYYDLNSIVDLTHPTDFQGQVGYVMLAEANFFIQALEINGYMFIVFKIDSVEKVISIIGQYLSEEDIDEF